MQLLLKLRNLSLHLATFIKVTQPTNHLLDLLLHKLGRVLHTKGEGEAHTQRQKTKSLIYLWLPGQMQEAQNISQNLIEV